MKFTLEDRFMLLNVLPAEESIVNLRIIRDLQTALAPTDAEKTEFEIAEVKLSNGFKYPIWNEAKAKGVFSDVSVGANAFSLITERLRDLNKDKRLSVRHIGLYERFVEGKKTKADFEDEAANAKMNTANKDVELPKPQGPAKEKPRQKPSK